MPSPHISRRSFVIGGGLAALAAACSSGDDKEKTSAGSSTTLGQGDQPIQGGAAAGDVFAGSELRFPFGVLRNSEDGSELVIGEPVTIGFRGPDRNTIAPMTATFRGAGLDTDQQHDHADGVSHIHDFERKGIYAVRTTFPTPGAWTADLDVAGQSGEFSFEVLAEPRAPMIGEPAPTAPSPTVADSLDVEPICTRDPACPLHEVSLDNVIGDTPVVVMFSTPARCQSRWCGPVLELLLDARERYLEQATFVHVEIYRDLQSYDFVPTLEAWGFESEPWLYAIDERGTIVDRLEGAFDLDEITALLDTLTS